MLMSAKKEYVALDFLMEQLAREYHKTQDPKLAGDCGEMSVRLAELKRMLNDLF